MRIDLLGRPTIRDDRGEPVALPGKKTWALIARVLLTETPVSRRRLADELFSTADDPMGALRWSLAQARRAVGDPETFCNDPVEANLRADLVVDVRQLDHMNLEPHQLPGLLLEGLHSEWSAEFDVWLSVERWRVESQVAAALRRSTINALSARDAPLACTLARELVARMPLEEGSHVLLVRALVLSGDMATANERVVSCVELFRRELNVDPTSAMRSALREGSLTKPPGVSFAASAKALLDAGNSAVDAGAADAGIESLRRAVVDAERSNDTQLLGVAQCALGSALIHAIRGLDDEGAVVMHGAVEAALAASDNATAATALMELGYVEQLAGRRQESAGFLAHAEVLAADLPEVLSGVLSFTAGNLADWGRAEEALEMFQRALDVAERDNHPRNTAWAKTFGARTLIHLGRYDEAEVWLDAALLVMIDEKWHTVRPIVELFLLELDRLRGRDPLAIRADLERVFAESCQLGDPCWEGLAARGIGLTYTSAEDADTAYAWLEDGIARCTRVSDTWVWVEADVLEREMELAMHHNDTDRARSTGERLLRHSARKQLDSYTDRAKERLAQLS